MITETTETITHLLAWGIALMQLALIAAVAHRLIYGVWVPRELHHHLERFGLWVAALLPVSAFFLSLWYSEIVGIPVCPLCWFARTMMYPLAVILVVAALRKDIGVVPYAYPLAVIGALITGYHHLYQMGIAPSGACDVLAGGGECATRYIFELGYITMPLMGFTLFCAIGLLLWVLTKENSKQ